MRGEMLYQKQICTHALYFDQSKKTACQENPFKAHKSKLAAYCPYLPEVNKRDHSSQSDRFWRALKSRHVLMRQR